MNVITYEHPDTSEGALAALAALSCLDLTDATTEPDPQVRGVWKVSTPSAPGVDFAVVYLAGHPDSWGQKREYNDFECYERMVEECAS